MLEPLQGSVRLFGLDPRRDPLEVKRRIGFVSEDQLLPPFLRIDQVLAMYRTLFRGWDDSFARDLLQRFDLGPQARIGQLSKGQARRVALVCAVAHRPELLLLDEPAGGLDPAARREFLETSIRLLNETGTTILFSSHHMADVERVAERVVMLHGGCVLLNHGLDTLREQFCLALLPRQGVDQDSLRRGVSACLSIRSRGDEVRAVLGMPPEQGQALLTRELGIASAHCTTLALEDMFVELVGGAS
jgi:ABC-2 type transport system ATP-binding protein